MALGGQLVDFKALGDRGDLEGGLGKRNAATDVAARGRSGGEQTVADDGVEAHKLGRLAGLAVHQPLTNDLGPDVVRCCRNVGDEVQLLARADGEVEFFLLSVHFSSLKAFHGFKDFVWGQTNVGGSTSQSVVHCDFRGRREGNGGIERIGTTEGRGSGGFDKHGVQLAVQASLHVHDDVAVRECLSVEPLLVPLVALHANVELTLIAFALAASNVGRVGVTEALAGGFGRLDQVEIGPNVFFGGPIGFKRASTGKLLVLLLQFHFPLGGELASKVVWYVK